MLASVGETDSVSLNGVPSARSRSKNLISGMYVSVTASKNQRSSRKRSYSGMADVGQMGVQDQQQVSLRHG